MKYQQSLLRAQRAGEVYRLNPAQQAVLRTTVKGEKRNQKGNKATEGNSERSKSLDPRVKRFQTHSLISSMLPAGSMLGSSERYVKRLVSIVPY
jgi:hypothetical protein